MFSINCRIQEISFTKEKKSVFLVEETKHKNIYSSSDYYPSSSVPCLTEHPPDFSTEIEKMEEGGTVHPWQCIFLFMHVNQVSALQRACHSGAHCREMECNGSSKGGLRGLCRIQFPSKGFFFFSFFFKPNSIKYLEFPFV